jgi:glycosyltransferase involved in cell wall biosynthesis
MIVKNEAPNLPDCLRGVADLVDEIVIVDTGSTDDTAAIAAGFGAKVVNFVWVDSFAAARNECLRHATGDWIFWFDADDRLDDTNRAKLKELLARLPDGNRAFIMSHSSVQKHLYDSALVVEQTRLFRKVPDVAWRGRVHEQVLPSLSNLPGFQAVFTDVVIQHLGYQDAVRLRQKHLRNRRLFELEHTDDPNEPFTLYNLAAISVEMGEPKAAIPYLRRCLENASPENTFLPRVYLLFAQIHQRLGDLEEGLKWCREGIARFPNDVELWFEQGMIHQGQKDAAGGQRCFEHVLRLPPRRAHMAIETGLASHVARHHLALAFHSQRRFGDAAAQWNIVVQQQPHFSPAWLGLTEISLAQRQLAAVQSMIDRLSVDPADEATAAVLRARLFLHLGDCGSARRIFEQAIERSPHLLWLRLIYSEVLIREGKDLDLAARYLADLLAVDPTLDHAKNLWAEVQTRASGSPS